MNTKFSGLIGTRSHHASGLRITTHDDGLSLQLGPVSLLDGGIKCIHINVDYFANWLHRAFWF
jgi:hypothetical protein